MKHLALIVSLAFPFTSSTAEPADLRSIAGTLIESAGESQVVEGRDGWLFFVPELRHLAAGPFWGENATSASRASRSDWADPLPIIVDFAEQVRRAGAELVFVPVPPKAVLYPDKLPNGKDTPDADRADTVHTDFLGELRGSGVAVVDLAPVFLAHRKEHGDTDAELLFCRTDTHWSPQGCAVAARAILDAIGEKLPAPAEPLKLKTEEESLTFTGDLASMVGGDKTLREILPAVRVIDTATEQPPANNRDSPLLLLGDSHLLVFEEGGDMHASGAGLASQIALLHGSAPDVLGVRGSGASPSRISLMRRGDKLAGKKVVVWLLTSREYTETQGWRPVPVVPAGPEK